MASTANGRAHRERSADRVPLRGAIEEFVGQPTLLEPFLIGAGDGMTVCDEAAAFRRCAAGVKSVVLPV
jgi:hypothetical protein